MLVNTCVYSSTMNVNIVDKVYNLKNEYLNINVTVPQIEIKDCNEKVILINEKIIKWTEDWMNDVKQIADSYYKNQTKPLIPYELFSDYKVTNNMNIVSFYIDYYQFTGGAHGATTRIAYNVDCKTGKQLQIQDLFKEGYDFKSIIDNEIIKQINKKPDEYFKDKDGFNGIDNKVKFYVKDNEIVIYYGEYEIAPYASGLPEFTIDTNIFNGNYIYGKINNS